MSFFRSFTGLAPVSCVFAGPSGGEAPLRLIPAILRDEPQHWQPRVPAGDVASSEVVRGTMHVLTTRSLTAQFP